MRILSVVFSLYIFLVLPGCSSLMEGGDGVKNLQTPEIIPGLPKGYECPLVPTGFDPAGSIFRLDKSGTYFRVANRPKDPSVLEGINMNVKVADYIFSDTQKSSGDLSFELLKRVLPGLSASAKAKFKKDLVVDITVKDLVAEVVLDTSADRIVALFASKNRPKRGNRYFLVRETFLAGEVAYDLGYKDLSKIGGKAKVTELAGGNVDVTFNDNAGKVKLNQKFKPRIQVCIKVAEINFGGIGTLSDGAKPKLSDATLPTIRRDGNQK